MIFIRIVIKTRKRNRIEIPLLNQLRIVFLIPQDGEKALLAPHLL